MSESIDLASDAYYSENFLNKDHLISQDEKNTNILYKKQIEHKNKGQILRSSIFGLLNGTVVSLLFIIISITSGIETETMLIFSMTIILTNALCLAICDYFSTKSQVDFKKAERKREFESTQTTWRMRILDLEKILINRGLNEVDAMTIAHLYAKNKNLWVDLVMVEELGGIETQLNPGKNAVSSFLAFLGSALFMALPFLFCQIFGVGSNKLALFWISLGIALIFLAIAGSVITNYTKRAVFISIVEIYLYVIGLGVLGFLLALLFRGWAGKSVIS